MVDLRDGSVIQVADQAAGLSGQSWIGPTFAAGALFWYRSCLGDPGACNTRTAGTFRYSITLRKYALAGRSTPQAGFAYAGGRAYLAAGDSQCADHETSPACALVLTDPLAFVPVPSRAH